MTTQASGRVRLAKTQRQHLVAKLLAQHGVSSQEALVDLLGGEGVAATQATVSLDSMSIDRQNVGPIPVYVGLRSIRPSLPFLIS